VTDCERVEREEAVWGFVSRRRILLWIFMAGRLGLLLAPGSTKAQKHLARVRGPWLGGLAHCNWAACNTLSGPVRVLTSVPTAATNT